MIVPTLMLAPFAIGSMDCAPDEPNELDTLGKVSIQIKGATVELWIADDDEERTRGLMFVTKEELATKSDGTHRGMIFVFERAKPLDFWMKNTIIPLDIAYVSTEGVVVATYTMAPLDDRSGQYPSHEAARFAVEVKAGLWSELGLKKGDRIPIPESLLKGNP